MPQFSLQSKKVDAGASTVAGSSSGDVCVLKGNFNCAFFLIEMIWFGFHIHVNKFLVQSLLKT